MAKCIFSLSFLTIIIKKQTAFVIFIYSQFVFDSYMSFTGLIRLSAEKRSIFNGKAIHARIVVSGSHQDVQTNNHLLSMYAKLGHVHYAQNVFDRMADRNLITWTSLISGYYQMGWSGMALNCFRALVVEDGMIPNEYTYVAAMSACAQIGALRSGKEIHGRIYRMLINANSFVSNSLINLYGKCGLLKSARVVFDTMNELNVVSCVSLISSYMQNEESEEGLRVFVMSLRMGIKLNEFSCGSILGACAALECMEFGMQVQCLALKSAVAMDQVVITSLVNLYAKCGELELAGRALREADAPGVTAWTALIGGCMQEGKCKEAIHLFGKILDSGLKPTEQTFASVLGAFGNEMETKGALQLHCWIVKAGFGSFAFVSNALLDFYAKIGCLDASFKVFYGISGADIVGWNSMIAACVSSGHYDDAIGLVQNMEIHGFSPNIYTYSSLLKICGGLSATKLGKETHCCILKPGFDSNVVVGTALIDMYAKCGRLSDAQQTFDLLPSKSLITWNTMISSYALHGFGREALEIYNVMLMNEVKPNAVTFVGVLSSCAHQGDLEEALRHFESMTERFGIIPRADHVACVVSLYARKGQSEEAYDFIRTSGEPSKVVWRCLLSGCVSTRDLDLAKHAADQILSIDPYDTSALVMLSNIYADSDMWNEASQVRKLMKEKTLKKEIGYSRT